MGRLAGKLTLMIVMIAGSLLVGAMFSYNGAPSASDTDLPVDQSVARELQPLPTEAFDRAGQSAILASATPEPSPTKTLKPPPTFEPPTATPTASQVPTQTLTPTTVIDVSIPGLRGAETPTPTSTPGCEPREDWHLTYTVQFDDALANIADKYGVWVDELAEGNCIADKNVIYVGQVLHVPGDEQPYEPEVECVPFQLFTPHDGTFSVEADGNLTFNWIGPQAPINLIRIHLPDGSTYERVIELRQNETINTSEYLTQEGTYTWYVYPLDSNFWQIDCPEGGPWTFYKPASTGGSSSSSSQQMGG